MSCSKATAPIYQPGGNNPYGYLATHGANSSPAGSGSIPVTYATPTLGNALVKEPIAQKPAMELIISKNDDDIDMCLFDIENGVRVKMELKPEADISPLEQLRLSVLIQTVISLSGHNFNFKPLAYARRYHIDRHFRLSVA